MVSQALGIKLFKHRSRLGSRIPLSNTKCGNFPVKGTQHDRKTGGGRREASMETRFAAIMSQQGQLLEHAGLAPNDLGVLVFEAMNGI